MHECPEVEKVLRARLFLDLRQAGLEQTALAGFQADSFNLPGGNGFAVAFKAPKEDRPMPVSRKAWEKKHLSGNTMSAKQISKRIDELTESMLKLARELKFEEAAALRDEIADLKQALILMPGLDD